MKARVDSRIARIGAVAAALASVSLVGMPAASAATPATIQPLDHTGCNQVLCINVESRNGSGPYITYMSGSLESGIALAQSQYVYLYWGEWNQDPNNNGAKYLGSLGEAETKGPVNVFTDVPNDEFSPRIFTIGHYICLTAIGAEAGALPGRPCAEVQ
jgi:hypothetical protein